MTHRVKITDTSVPQPVKFGQQELTSEHQCPMRTNVLKRRTPEEPFINPSILEQVSDDLVLLRCFVCKLAGPNSELVSLVPEPWYNKSIILKRLMELDDALYRDVHRGTCSGIIARIKIAIEEADE